LKLTVTILQQTTSRSAVVAIRAPEVTTKEETSSLKTCGKSLTILESFFFDSRNGKLYLYHNGSGPPPPDMEVVVPQLQVLLNVTGTQWDPVQNLSLKGLKFTASAHTYMMPHAVPSAGDWALTRSAAVFLQGTELAEISNCTFERLDGHALMVSGYNRNATIADNDFAFLGGSAMVLWGYTNETSGAGHPAAGIDGTDGNHPRYTSVLRNLAHEVGLYEKQNSFFMQAKTAQSTIMGNVFFNGPRAGVNYNDGFGGGDVLAYNLVFSACRESGDHGPFNSWDRQPYLTTVATGEPSLIMAWREIHHNFFIDNYSPGMNVDNDDGSYNYRTHHNFLVYAQYGLKSDFGGHDNIHEDNLYAYVDSTVALWKNDFLDGYRDQFINNRVVFTDEASYFLVNNTWACDGPGKPFFEGNAYYTANGSGLKACGEKFTDWQQAGNDVATTVHERPPDEVLLSWARELLDIHTGGTAATGAQEAPALEGEAGINPPETIVRWELPAQHIASSDAATARLNNLTGAGCAVALGICSAALLLIISSGLHRFFGIRAKVTLGAAHDEELVEEACGLEANSGSSCSLLEPK